MFTENSSAFYGKNNRLLLPLLTVSGEVSYWLTFLIKISQIWNQNSPRGKGVLFLIIFLFRLFLAQKLPRSIQV